MSSLDTAEPLLRILGRVPFDPTYAAMRAFTDARTPDTPDELWLCEHDPVYTQGIAGKPEHVFAPEGVPIVQTNRGGQVTYHGPGQVVAYPLIDLKRLGPQGIYVKEYVYRIEEAVIRSLAEFGVTGHRVLSAPGIYVRLDDPFAHGALRGPADPRDPFRGLGKISALGIKIANHRTYHGVALNVAMDLSPYQRINPCGYAGLQTVDLATLGVHAELGEVAARLGTHLTRLLSA